MIFKTVLALSYVNFVQILNFQNPPENLNPLEVDQKLFLNTGIVLVTTIDWALALNCRLDEII
jgi:hypothetical protein